MTKVFSHTIPLEADILDAFCVLQKSFTDQFVYYEKSTPRRAMGLGRCIALPSLYEVDQVLQGPCNNPATFFSFKRFDAYNPKPADEMMRSFPNVPLMLPEVVLLQDEHGCYLQVNSLGPVYEGRVERFATQARSAWPHTSRAIDFSLESDSYAAWQEEMQQTLDVIKQGRAQKLVPSRRAKVQAKQPFSSKDLLVNLIDGTCDGTVFMYRYGDVFFCGCTPELLVRKNGAAVESMCLAGTTSTGKTEVETQARAAELFNDEKNRTEHEYVVHFVREVLGRTCYNVDIPIQPTVVAIKQLQHLLTPVHAQAMSGTTLITIARQLHPTPALAGYPVGEALCALREIEPYNRGFFGGAVGCVDANGNGAFSVAIRCGVFDGMQGYIYAGCGVVAQSDAQAEFDETNLKMKTILSAFSGE